VCVTRKQGGRRNKGSRAGGLKRVCEGERESSKGCVCERADGLEEGERGGLERRGESEL
jgi:hypothetical protein